MSDYSEDLAKLEAMLARLNADMSGPISTLVHSYEVPVRDLIAILIPMLKALAPPAK